MKAHSFVVPVLSFFLGSLVLDRSVHAQQYYNWWHFSLSQTGRNAQIYNQAVAYPIGSYGGECKIWVQNVTWSASRQCVWLPQNLPGCDWMWYNSAWVDIMAQDRWDGVAMRPGQILQAQVRVSYWPYVSPHTMIVLWADSWGIGVAESNYGPGSNGRVSKRVQRWADFKRSIIHYTLYQVR